MSRLFVNPRPQPRIFFALWPDEQTRKQVIIRKQQAGLTALSGRAVKEANLHITLHFIGNTTLDALYCMDSGAARVNTPAFTLELDQLGYFKKPAITWLGCKLVPIALLELQLQLGEQLTACNFMPEKRAYKPHMSLYRKSTTLNKPVAIEKLSWTVRHFSLIESVIIKGDVFYHELNRYKLA